MDQKLDIAIEGPFSDVVGYQAAPPESQFSLNWQMLDAFGGNVQVTMRGSLISEWPDIMFQRSKFVELAQLRGWTFPGSVRPSTAPPLAAATAAATPAKAAAFNTSTAAAPTNGNGPEIFYINTTELRVTPRTDGKVNLEFWNAGRKYAEINAVKTPADAAVLLQATGGWTADHFKAVATYPLPVTVAYRNSENLNKAGKPYKNIIDIRMSQPD